MLNNEDIIKDFPILNEKIHNNRLVYLDNAATTQKPLSVLTAMDEYYKKYNANPHRGAHKLSIEATQIYESTREKVKKFINAKSSAEIVFTKNTTEAINLVAYSYGMNFLKNGDEIVICISEHHSNLIPWQQVSKKTGAILKYMYVDEEGILSLDEIKDKLTEKTKLVSIAHVSNTFGIINPVKEVIAEAHKKGALVFVDGAQSIQHMKEDVQDLDYDFFAFSGHKMLGPMGIGVLYAKRELLEKIPPFLYGGDMIEYVDEQETSFAELPFKFEAGTQNVGAASGLSAAIDYINSVGFSRIKEIDDELIEYAIKKLKEIPYVKVYGPSIKENRIGVISFNIEDIHPHDVSSIIDNNGIAIRSGHHCAQPFMKFMNLNSTCRASFYIYNSLADVDELVGAIKKVRGVLGYGS